MSGDAPLRASPSALSCVASLLGHTERVWSVSWHPSGRLLASCSSDKTIRVWRHSGDEWASGWECCAVLDAAHTRTVRSVSWSPCGRLLASAGFDGRVTVWAVKQHSATSREQQQRGGEEEEKGEEERSSETGGAVSSGRVSAECVCALEGHESEVKSVSWSADGRLLASCSRDKSVWVWERDEAADGSLGFECVSVCSGHSADVKHVAFHPQLSLLLSASYDNSVRVWREEEEEAGGEWEAAQTLDGHSSTVWMADWLRPHQQKQQPAQPDTPPHSAVCESVVSAGDDRTVRVWSPTQPLSSHSAAAIAASTYACTQTLVTPHTRSIFALHQHAHSGLLATCGADDSICLYTAVQVGGPSSSVPPPFRVAVQHKRAHQGDVNCVRFHPSPLLELLASAGDDSSIKLWKVQRMQEETNGATLAARDKQSSSIQTQ